MTDTGLPTLSSLHNQLWNAQRAVQHAEDALNEALREVNEINSDISRKLYVCDHPDTTGFRCDHCGEFAPHPEEYRDMLDRLAIIDADIPHPPGGWRLNPDNFANGRMSRWPLP